MLTDITLGQYFPGDSLLHRMDARVKIILLFFYIEIGRASCRERV